MVDPREGRRSLELFVLDQDGWYAPARPDVDERIASEVLPGVWIDPAWAVLDEPQSVRRLGPSVAGVELPARP